MANFDFADVRLSYNTVQQKPTGHKTGTCKRHCSSLSQDNNLFLILEKS